MNINKPFMLIFMLALNTITYAGNNDISNDSRDGSHSKEEHHGNNHLALFTGVTIHNGHTSFSSGVDYEFLVHSMVGIVGVVELVFADEIQTISGGGLLLHPFAAAKIGVILAAEMADGHTALLTRANIGYDIHLGSISITPTFNLDLVSSHFVYVTGLAFGMGF